MMFHGYPDICIRCLQLEGNFFSEVGAIVVDVLHRRAQPRADEQRALHAHAQTSEQASGELGSGSGDTGTSQVAGASDESIWDHFLDTASDAAGGATKLLENATAPILLDAIDDATEEAAREAEEAIEATDDVLGTVVSAAHGLAHKAVYGLASAVKYAWHSDAVQGNLAAAHASHLWPAGHC